MIYKLAEQYPDCLMLNFTIKVEKNCKIFLNSRNESGSDLASVFFYSQILAESQNKATVSGSSILVFIFSEDVHFSSNMLRVLQ